MVEDADNETRNETSNFKDNKERLRHQKEKMSNKVYLVTGANVGIGLEASRQLALLEDTKVVYMACRTESKAMSAIDQLAESRKDFPKSKLSYVHFDASATKEEISKIVHDISQSFIHGLILNAGGMGNDASGRPTAPNQVLDIFQINLVGHIHLVEAFVAAGLLAGEEEEGACRMVFAGSEAARGMPSMCFPPPMMGDTEEFYHATLKGTSRRRFDFLKVYAESKGLAALYFAAWARRHPVTVLVVSPGATMGTNVTSADAIPRITRTIVPMMMPILGRIGMFHSVEMAARRYIDAVLGNEEYRSFPSGTFIASARGSTGRVCDQAELRQGEQYADTTKQELVYKVLQDYV